MEACKEYNGFNIATLVIMCHEYLNGTFDEAGYQDKYLREFKPIRAEIDAANKKKKKENFLK